MARSSTADAYDKFRFEVSWSDGSEEGSSDAALAVAGFHDASAPGRATGEVPYRNGNQKPVVQKSAGLTNMEDVVLSRGATADVSFFEWAKDVYSPNEVAAPRQYRKTVIITLKGRDDLAVKRYILFECWPKGFKPGSDLSATDDGEKSMESLTLAYEDFEVEEAGDDGTFV